LKAQPIPTHLRQYAWYAPHQAWLRDQGLAHHDPGDASPKRAVLVEADLRGANLEGADLRDADLRGANLRGANLVEADLRGANLEGADLTGANLVEAVLWGANLTRAVLWGANLEGADLRGANLEGAVLTRADLWGANLTRANLARAVLKDAILGGAMMADGRTLAQWQSDPLAGLCDTPEAVERATAAWGKHSWADCPMHEAHGWSRLEDAPTDKRQLVATFVALFDGRHLPKPESEEI